MSKTISAAANPALANNLLKQATQEESLPVVQPEITPPSDTMVELPGGYLSDTGEVIRTAEIREMTGRDEEAVAKTNNLAKALLTILQRCVVKIGKEPATEEMLDNLLSGDRDMLLLGILKATFGSTPRVGAYCGGCQEVKEVLIDINSDIKVKVLVNSIEDRVFTVKGKSGEITVQLPTGKVQKELINNADKTGAELTTALLEGTVLKINDNPIFNKTQVQNLSILDRRKIVEELNARVPGPQFKDLTTVCPDCESEVTVPITLDSLFRL